MISNSNKNNELPFQNAQVMYARRVLKGAVQEAAQYPRALCNQHCKTHLYFKDGQPLEQLTGKKHDCIMTRIAKMFIGHYHMIRIANIELANPSQIVDNIRYAEEFCRKWDVAFDEWKETGIVPSSEEVESF